MLTLLELGKLDVDEGMRDRSFVGTIYENHETEVGRYPLSKFLLKRNWCLPQRSLAGRDVGVSTRTNYKEETN